MNKEVIKINSLCSKKINTNMNAKSAAPVESIIFKNKF
jgi:hypothetical protein